MGAGSQRVVWLLVFLLAVVLVIAVARDDIVCFVSGKCGFGGGGGPPGAGTGLWLEEVPEPWRSCAARDDWYSPRAIENMLAKAEAGHIVAQYAAANAYFTGLGLVCDPREGAEWMHRAAVLGLPHAEYAMGVLSQWGFGMPADQAAARDWFARAADDQHAGAINALAVLEFVNTVGGDAAADFDIDTCLTGDCLLAVRDHLETAARYRSDAATVNLGFVYGFIASSLEAQGAALDTASPAAPVTGDKVYDPRDYYIAAGEYFADAYFWYSLAALYVDDEGVRAVRDALADRLPPETVRGLDEDAAAWLPDRPVPPANLPINIDPNQFQ